MTKRKKAECSCSRRPWGTGDFIAISAMRYAMGRRSYVVGMTIDWIRWHWSALSRNARLVMTRDLEEEINRLELFPGCLGMSFDEEAWKGLYEFMRREGVESHE